MYEFKAYNATCNASQIFTITQNPNYTFTVSSNPGLVVKNEHLSFEATNTSAATLGISYSWFGFGQTYTYSPERFYLYTDIIESGSGNVSVTGKATGYCRTTQKSPYIILNPINWEEYVCKNSSTTLSVDTTGVGGLFGGRLTAFWEQKLFTEVTWTSMTNQENQFIQTLTPLESTNYRVTLVLKDSLDNVLYQKIYSKGLTVIDLQMGPTQTFELCKDAICSLQGGTVEGIEWQWEDENRNVLSGWSSNYEDAILQNLSPSDTTTYYFVARNGSCIQEQAHVVNVKPWIDFTTNRDDVVTCRGDVVNIVPTSTVPTTGVSYSWSVDGASAVNTNIFTFWTDVARNGTVKVTPSATGYCGTPLYIPYSVEQIHASPDNWPTTFSSGTSLTLNVNVSQIGSLPMTMEWYENEVAQGINEPSAIFNPTQTSTYRFEVSNGLCSEISWQTIEMVFPDAIENVEATDFSINLFPNPASETTTINLTGVNGYVKVSLMDLSGKECFTSVEESSNGNLEKALDVSALVQGAYLLKVECNGVEKTKLFVKK